MANKITKIQYSLQIQCGSAFQKDFIEKLLDNFLLVSKIFFKKRHKRNMFYYVKDVWGKDNG